MNNGEKGNHVFLKRINLLLFVLVGALLLAFLYYPKYKKLHQLNVSENQLDQDIIRKEKEIKDLKERQKALIQDKESLEQVARDKLGYSSSGEIIYQFEEEESHTAESP
ncbi:MAG: septum formation initiator family protein [Candidatus Aureabacteria bacterium]|nr:septum formation initiator family protein [Candidatus Auribacterota bacterium]